MFIQVIVSFEISTRESFRTAVKPHLKKKKNRTIIYKNYYIKF